MLKRVCDKCGKEKTDKNSIWFFIAVDNFKGTTCYNAASRVGTCELCPECFNKLDILSQFANNN